MSGSHVSACFINTINMEKTCLWSKLNAKNSKLKMTLADSTLLEIHKDIRANNCKLLCSMGCNSQCVILLCSWDLQEQDPGVRTMLVKKGGRANHWLYHLFSETWRKHLLRCLGLDEIESNIYQENQSVTYFIAPKISTNITSESKETTSRRLRLWNNSENLLVENLISEN